MDVFIIFAIAAISLGICWKAWQSKSLPAPVASEVLAGGFKCILFIAAQSLVMVLLMLTRGLGKSLTNGAYQFIYVIGISAVGSIFCLILQEKKANLSAWITLYILASILNIVLWELTPSLPE